MAALAVFGGNVVLGLVLVLVSKLFSPLAVPLSAPNEEWILPAAMTLVPALLGVWFWSTCGALNMTVIGRCQRPKRGIFSRCHSHDEMFTLHDALGLVWVAAAFLVGAHFLGPLFESLPQAG